MFVTTLLCQPGQAAITPTLAQSLCNAWGGRDLTWLAPREAVEFECLQSPDTLWQVWQELQAQQIDLVVQPSAGRRKKMLLADMDSTMITVECIDELADFAGIKPQIAAITERAMAGELDFAEALKARVALLAGLDENMIAQCLRERVRPMPGAEILVRTMTGWGAHAVLVSGGFTSFTGPVAELLGFTEVHANVLEIKDGCLTGGLKGNIVDAAVKKAVLHSAAVSQGIPLEASIAVGDGANDLPMIAAAVAGDGLGIGYHPRPQLAKAANFSVRHNDLTALLFAQGVAPNEWLR